MLRIPLILWVALGAHFCAWSHAQDIPNLESGTPSETAASQEASSSTDNAGAGSGFEAMTLMDMIRAGGVILYAIMALSVFSLVMAVYYLITITPGREAPSSLMKRAVAQVRAGDVRGAYQMCEERDELLANVLRAGLKMYGHDRFVIQEAMESEGERGAAQLWQRISYLNNVGAIAPLLGLLGTVWGMMGAFGTIAFNNTESRGEAMAYSVAQAMVTTAAGLMLAIPALLIYYYLRGRVVAIVCSVESSATEMVELLARRKEE
ncbi:MAG: hypothetical protein AMXMBFR84_36940 [Candidatus Hydrogenedentota bacterium]